MADQDTPLTSLCSICYTNPPKYVCPRDHVRTCSLPCYKRHQQRASCNGKRDPTAYVKKDQLTTAAGIDHDYNFLSGVEHEFDRADRDRGIRGIGEADQGTRRRWAADGSLQRYLRQHNILVDRAPVGMSRQKANQSRYIQKSKRIVWTVEWVETDGSKRLSEAHEAASLGDAYAAMLADKERESKKRKRGTSAEPSANAKANTNEKKVQTQSLDNAGDIEIARNSGANSQSENGVERDASQIANAESSSFPEAAVSAKLDDTTPPIEATAVVNNPETQSDDPAALGDSHVKDDTRSLILSRIQSEQERQAALRQAKLPTGPPFFYLLRPHTTHTSRVMIPLHPENSLTSSLADQTVLEFPTIYVMDQGQDELATGYITEEAYLKAKQEEDQEVEELLKAVPGSAAERGGGEGGAGAGVLDPSKILEMLKRDVPN